MTIKTTDPEFREVLRTSKENVDVLDSEGRYFGTFYPGKVLSPEGFLVPIDKSERREVSGN